MCNCSCVFSTYVLMCYHGYRVIVGDWSIQVSTLETIQNGEVALVVYGDRGNSGPIQLGAPGKSIFLTGNKDEFRVSTVVMEMVPFVFRLVKSLSA